jgi:RNA polymerase sigma-70 factor (ECF subfamily)
MRFDRRTDEDVLDDLRRGDAQALSALFDRYGRLVYQIARQILRNDAEAEDLMQEIFLEVYRKAEQYDSHKGTVKIWLLQYAYHRGFNRRKYIALRRYYNDHPAAALEEAEFSRSAPGHAGMTAQEWQQVLRRGMRELNTAEHKIICLVAFDGLTLREASEHLGEPYTNGRNLYYRGLRKLRQFLEEPRPGKEVGDVRA